jgi:hypothetical protein
MKLIRIRFPWLRVQLPSQFLERLIPLLAVTWTAACDQVLPGIFSSFRLWNDVVESEFLSSSTINTLEVISHHDVPSIEGYLLVRAAFVRGGLISAGSQYCWEKEGGLN